MPPRKSKFKKTFFIFLSVIVLGVLAGEGWYRYTYPYGWSHCCILNLGAALEQYAADHGGRFPSGGGCPEASLGLLYSNYIDADTLRGKSVSLRVVERALSTNGKLGPESCGWHYVEGLTFADDPEIAIAWDKVGLGHNGERFLNGAHEVTFVGGGHWFIPSTNWSNFLKGQQDLLAHRTQEAIRGIPGLMASIRLPTGQVLTNCNSSYELSTTETSHGFTGHGTQSGSHLDLMWYHVYPADGEVTWVLNFRDESLRSKPVTFSVKDGRATPGSIIFEMENY